MRTPPPAARLGSQAGSTPVPKARWHSSTAAVKSARAWSRWVIAMARGMPTSAHSVHSSPVAPSTPSTALTTNRAASAARRPARSSPTKSGYPGVSSRLMVSPRWLTEHRERLTDREGR